jgi:uncharacterized protein YozE (UPF0346 family)
MKAIKFFYIYFFLSTLNFSAVIASDPIPLKDASNQKIVSINIHGIKTEIGSYKNHHYGDCITVELKNLSYNNINLKLEAGRLLICDYDSIQNMMITKSLIFALKPKESATYNAYAMCVEKTDHSPDHNSTFKIGEMAKGYLLELAKLLEQNNYQDNAGQNAVWALTNNNDTANIYTSDKDECSSLRKFVSQTKGFNKNITDNTIYLENDDNYISGNIAWEMANKGNASLIVYDEKGKFVTTIFTDKKYEAGEQSCNFKVVSCLIEKNKKYFVKLKIWDTTKEELVCMAK